MSQYGIVIYTSYRINFLTIKAASLLLMVELEQQGNKAMKKIICLAMIAWTMWVVPAEAQYDENDYSGYSAPQNRTGMAVITAIRLFMYFITMTLAIVAAKQSL